MAYYRSKSHERHMPDMLVQPASGVSHLISSHTGESSMRVALRDLRHQGRSVLVSGRFARYEVILCHLFV